MIFCIIVRNSSSFTSVRAVVVSCSNKQQQNLRIRNKTLRQSSTTNNRNNSNIQKSSQQSSSSSSPTRTTTLSSWYSQKLHCFVPYIEKITNRSIPSLFPATMPFSKKKENSTKKNKEGLQEQDDTDVDKLAEELQSHLKVEEKTTNVQEEDDDEDIISAAPHALKEFAKWIENGDIKQFIVVLGAGVSVSAGIPDFRTPGTGLYDNLQNYNLPYPEAVFDLNFYAQNPTPFCQLAKEIWPGQLNGPVPTVAHSFLSLLAQKKLLLRVYTQNIDGLEILANIPEELTVECHGHFRTASCIKCSKPATDMEYVRKTIIEEGQVPKCAYCNGDDNSNKQQHKNNRSTPGYIKPDIVFFGEGLPDRFHQLLRQDLRKADCCLVMGTSLQVAPVSHIPEMVDQKCKRVLLNREFVGYFDVQENKYHKSNNSSKKSTSSNSATKRDLFQPGDCDDSIMMLSRILGWKDELLEAHNQAKNAIRSDTIVEK